jgi:FkbM family methyltransferase
MYSVRPKADFLARMLGTIGYFRGKPRIADFFGRLACSRNAAGNFPLPDGKTASVDLSDRIQRLMWAGAYEPHVTRCITALLRPGDTFIDVGAHIGFFSLIASSRVGPDGHVFAFEANCDRFEELKSNAAAYPWLVCYSLAVWNKSGRIDFSNPQQPGESGWGKVAAVRKEGHVVTVEAISLDEWHEIEGFPAIRLIKIDAEGAEPFILEGMRRLVSKTHPYLIVELNDQLLRETGYSEHAIARIIRKDQYRIFAMTTDGLKEVLSDSNGMMSTELLCVPSDEFEYAKTTLQRVLPMS